MCQQSGEHLLGKTNNASITRCKDCGQYVLVFNNLCMSLNKEQLISFAGTLKDVRPEDYNKAHHSGSRHVLLRNSKTHFGVSLSRVDVSEILQVIQEAMLYEEVIAVLYTK